MKKKFVYKCETCGNVVESLWSGPNSVSCCGNEMVELVPNSVDAAVEKHVPMIVREGNQVTVIVGEVPHPMTPEHYILFIEVVAGDKVYRHDFKEGDPVADATFEIPEGEIIIAREYCNLHGFWRSK